MGGVVVDGKVVGTVVVGTVVVGKVVVGTVVAVVVDIVVGMIFFTLAVGGKAMQSSSPNDKSSMAISLR